MEKELLKLLKNLKKSDIVDLGEDLEGRTHFALKLPSGVASLKTNYFPISNFPEWNEYDE